MHISILLLPLLTGRTLAGCVYARYAEATAQGDASAQEAQNLATREAHPGGILDPREVDAADNIPRVLIGDLAKGITTAVGQDIANVIINSTNSQKTIAPARPTSTAACAKDACCGWYNISSDLTSYYGGCSDNARAAIRLGFHDAGGWDKTKTFGGADGSMVLFKEYTRAENNGLQNISQQMQTFYNKYHTVYNISMADLIQYAAIHAVRTCPKAPTLRAWIGRKDATQANTDGLLPGVNDAPGNLVNLFSAKTIVPYDLVALLGAHSTSKQFNVDTTKAGQSQDSTPTVWDVNFYNETLLATAPAGVFRFASDVALSTYNATKPSWQDFLGNQADWNEGYARAYTRVSLLGVNNINSLVECTQTLPTPAASAPRVIGSPALPASLVPSP